MGIAGDLRKWGEDHINKSLKQVDENTWLMGRFILRRSTTDHGSATWVDSVDGSAWSLSEVPDSDPLPAVSVSNSSISSETGVDSPHLKLIHEAGDASAAWAIGNDVICKIRFTIPGVTAESVTLDYVRKQKPSTFAVPDVLRQIFTDDRFFLLMKRIPGRKLDDAWLTLDEKWKNHYVDSIVNACMEMETWKGPKIGGVDGKLIYEEYLAGRDVDLNAIPYSCKVIGMDCSKLVFQHADLGPTNIIVEAEPVTGKIGIIDFELAGFFPRGWIRTKFRVSSGLDLTTTSDERATEWRKMVQIALEARGYEDYAQEFMKYLTETTK